MNVEKNFLCAEGKLDDVSDRIKTFLKYVSGGQPADAFAQGLEAAVKNLPVIK